MKQLSVQQKLDQMIGELGGRRPSVLLHACCAPCSSYCLEYLSRYFDITLYFYNPNMDSDEEYRKRAEECCRLVNEMKTEHPVKIIVENYDHEAFCSISEGLENEPERGKRCLKCYELRLRKTSEFMLADGNFDYFATTLTLSPLKNTDAINRIGKQLETDTGAIYLETDFKKKNGYLRSIELSREFGLYRQDYCGCKYSKRGIVS